MAQQPQERGPLWHLFSGQHMGRVCHAKGNKRLRGVVIFPCFFDFTSSLSPSYMVRWEENGRQWEEEVAADKLNITDVFSNRESFVPKQILELQRNNWHDEAGLFDVFNNTSEDTSLMAIEPPPPQRRAAQPPPKAKPPPKPPGSKRKSATPSKQQLAGSSGVSEAQDYVQSWTGVRIPKSCAYKPGDIPAGETADEEGDFEVEQVLDEVDYKGQRWLLLKWKGYELRMGTGPEAFGGVKGHKGDWEPSRNVQTSVLRNWEKRPSWWLEERERLQREKEGEEAEHGSQRKARRRA